MSAEPENTTKWKQLEKPKLPNDGSYFPLAPIRSGVLIPNGLIILAGIASPFAPIPPTIAFSAFVGVEARETPYMIEILVYFGWPFGLAALVIALPLALLANRGGLNGWFPAILSGATLGALGASFLNDGTSPAFLFPTMALGATYGFFLWAFSHILYGFARRRTSR